MDDRQIARAGAGEGELRAVALELDAAGRQRLDAYLSLLRRWGNAADLSGPGASPLELVADSLVGLRWLGERGTLLDVGSGAGIPAIPLLIGRPGWRGVLLEPRERRWAFLREVVRELELDADVRRTRLEQLDLGAFEAVSARGVTGSSWIASGMRQASASGVVLWWTSDEAATWAERAFPERVVRSPLPPPSKGVLLVWRRCST